MKTLIYDRRIKKVIEENAFKVSGLLFLYQTRTGKTLMNLILKWRFISVLYGMFMKSKRSLKQIPVFIKHYNIDLKEIKNPLNTFKSFNDFFIRELKAGSRPVDHQPEHLISPADSRLFVFPIDQAVSFPVKGYWYHLDQLVKDKELAAAYEGGWCFIYRLAPSDYHRYNYIDSGSQEKVITLNGVLHSVNPIALKEVNNIMAKNYRELTLLKTENFGDVVHIEVGALFVGKIVQRFQSAYDFKRGEEKGWFEFGGSTVIQLFKKGTILPDSDILEQSQKGIEVLVKLNEKVGLKL
ncbi:archaetidylserine decarboxylase [Pedobacter sp. L105]|uniref:archaetidylserine decarboxylase n=1 Tax=Pedobacter sp. L105 TaxID=1641871 RepID=UPI00131D7001|nr:archaetidylserine decarboxylase [Pedobacter sp. L105]